MTFEQLNRIDRRLIDQPWLNRGEIILITDGSRIQLAVTAGDRWRPAATCGIPWRPAVTLGFREDLRLKFSESQVAAGCLGCDRRSRAVNRGLIVA